MDYLEEQQEKERRQELWEYYWDSQYVNVGEAWKLANRFKKRLPVIHIRTAMEYAGGRRHGPCVGLDIAKMVEDGCLFTVEDVYKRGVKEGQRKINKRTPSEEIDGYVQTRQNGVNLTPGSPRINQD